MFEIIENQDTEQGTEPDDAKALVERILEKMDVLNDEIKAFTVNNQFGASTRLKRDLMIGKYNSLMKKDALKEEGVQITESHIKAIEEKKQHLTERVERLNETMLKNNNEITELETRLSGISYAELYDQGKFEEAEALEKDLIELHSKKEAAKQKESDVNKLKKKLLHHTDICEWLLKQARHEIEKAKYQEAFETFKGKLTELEPYWQECDSLAKQIWGDNILKHEHRTLTLDFVNIRREISIATARGAVNNMLNPAVCQLHEGWAKMETLAERNGKADGQPGKKQGFTFEG